MKTIAFYLPQFHPIPENDKWWGKGFTDWTNVTKAYPLFNGHFQPRLPADLGFYDLRLAEVRREQANLAKKYGLHGFCYHYYWFNGKKLLDLPLAKVLETKEPDFPFCICYANENWTRRWDGQEHEILMKQEHSVENDRHFIRDLIPVFQDERYIRINNKPLLLVYRSSLFPDPLQTTNVWREEVRKAGLEDLYLCKCQTFGDFENPGKSGFDAMVEFPPHCVEIAYSYSYQDMVTAAQPSFTGYVFDYLDTAAEFMNRQWPDYQLYKTVMLAWDNTARRGLSANIFHNFSVDFYERWLTKVIRRTIQKYPDEEQLVFINAWNEWAEGTYLEPDQKYGLGYLEATKRAITAGQSWGTIASSLQEFSKHTDIDPGMIEKGILTCLENKDTVEISLLKAIQERDTQIRVLESQLGVHRPNSLSYKYRELRDKLFPHGTRRREIAKNFKFRFQHLFRGHGTRTRDFDTNGDLMLARALKYRKRYGIRKTLARSFLEISQRIDGQVLNSLVNQSRPLEIIEGPHAGLTYTGERVLPSQKNDCFYAHLSLYNFAKDLIQNKVVVDAGCGVGYGAYYLAVNGAKAVYGVDISEEAIRFAKEHYRAPNLNYIHMDCENISFDEKFVDVIFSSNMIEHLKNYDGFFKSVKDVLMDDGILILATPPLYGGEPVEDNPFHHTNLEVGEWIDILSAYFTDIQTYRHLFRTDKKNKNGNPYILDFANAPEDCCIDEKDFYFEQAPLSSYRMRTETLTALFVASNNR